MLHRSLYKGEIIWNKTHKVMRGGTKEQVDRPKEEWITIAAPDLRIVSGDLWVAAQKRLRPGTGPGAPSPLPRAPLPSRSDSAAGGQLRQSAPPASTQSKWLLARRPQV